jgi:hypothetical protein
MCKSPHQGLCTVDCPYRATCTKDRIPLLIPAIVIHYRLGKIYPDEYINDIAIRRQELVNAVVHHGERQMDGIQKANIKINAV